MYIRRLSRFSKSHKTKLFSRFIQSESGSLIVFSLFLFLAMLMISGMAVDFMRNENVRVHLQSTVDRAVLAAADMEQSLSPEEVVHSYFEKAHLAPFLKSVTVTDGLTGRRVDAVAYADTRSMFLRLVGINSLPAPAQASAAEGRSKIEVSLVVDISGSMRRNSKMTRLHEAGQEFIDLVVDPEDPDLTSISIVPYTAQVNVGPELFSELPTVHRHNFSHCIDFEDADFNSVSLDLSKTYVQAQHFEWSSNYYNELELRNPGCPTQPFEQVLVHSQNVTELKSKIASFVPRANTSIHIGMKWGAALLDPAFRPITENLYRFHDKVENVFRDRPSDYDDSETKKFIVLMTDGQNVNTHRIQDWAYDSTSEIIFWARYPLWWYLFNEFPSDSIQEDFYESAYTASEADAQLDHVCTAAKDAGIMVYTIGFEVTNHAANVMRSCASSPSHFFRVEGVALTSAFSAIARDIVQLKLIN